MGSKELGKREIVSSKPMAVCDVKKVRMGQQAKAMQAKRLGD